MANSGKRRGADRYEESLFDGWRKEIAGKLALFDSEERALAHLRGKKLGHVALTYAPNGDQLGVFHIYTRGMNATVKKMLRPDLMFQRYVLTVNDRTGETRTFDNMCEVVEFCVTQADFLTSDMAQYADIDKLPARRAELCHDDLCEEMMSLRLKDTRRRRMAARRVPIAAPAVDMSAQPPIVDRSTKRPPIVDRSTKPGRLNAGGSLNGRRAVEHPCEDSEDEDHEYEMPGAAQPGRHMRRPVVQVDIDGNYGDFKWVYKYQDPR